MEFCDGGQVHLGYRRLKAALDAGLMVCLRPPHTTSVTQGEDTVHFGVFKPQLRLQKFLRQREKEEKCPAGQTASLESTDFGVVVKGPWEQAFSHSNVLSA